MAESAAKRSGRTLREQGARYVLSTQGQPVGVLLSLEEYERFLDLLDDEADSQDAELAVRLERAATPARRPKRLSFQEYAFSTALMQPHHGEHGAFGVHPWFSLCSLRLGVSSFSHSSVEKMW